MIAAMSLQRAHQEPNTTPPASFTQQPLTPPHSDQKSRTVVEDILHEIENRKAGRAPSEVPWLRYNLGAPSYKQLEDLIETDRFVKNKLRYCSNTSLDRVEHKVTDVKTQIRLLSLGRPFRASDAVLST
jgi:hypothetical protein